MNSIVTPSPAASKIKYRRINTWFITRSIKTKLKVIIMLVSTVGVLLAGSSLALYQWFDFRKNMAVDLSTYTDMIANNSEAAVLFGDKNVATEILQTLSSKPSIQSAIIFNSDGEVLSSYYKELSNKKQSNLANNKVFDSSQLLEFSEYRFTNRFLESQKSIKSDGKIIGNIYIRSDLSDLEKSLKQIIYTLIIILLLVELLAYFLASIMEKFISQPLIFLARLARRISEEQDYSLRAEKRTNDELGDLTDDFNTMLHQVEKRDKALRESEHRFQTLINQAADALYLCDLEGNILHINPSACNALGYSKSELLTMKFGDIDNQFTSTKGTRISRDHISQGESRTAYSEFKRKNGELFPVELHFGLLDLENETCVLSFARDITTRREAEAALQQAYDELENKVASRTQELSDSNVELVNLD